MFLGYRLKSLRKENKLSQTELGNILGVSKVSISGYEKGTRIPSMDKLNMLLDYFNVSADFLLGREVSVVCEDSMDVPVIFSIGDIEIIRELRSRPTLYNIVANNPKRFFSTINKKNI